MSNPGVEPSVPHPDDIVDEGKLERVLRRLGFSQPECAQLVGMTPLAFDWGMGKAPKGWRVRVEQALDLTPGSLKF